MLKWGSRQGSAPLLVQSVASWPHSLHLSAELYGMYAELGTSVQHELRMQIQTKRGTRIANLHITVICGIYHTACGRTWHVTIRRPHLHSLQVTAQRQYLADQCPVLHTQRQSTHLHEAPRSELASGHAERLQADAALHLLCLCHCPASSTATAAVHSTVYPWLLGR